MRSAHQIVGVDREAPTHRLDRLANRVQERRVVAAFDDIGDPIGDLFRLLAAGPDVVIGAGETGPIAVLALESADPTRDAAFWAALSGWMPGQGPVPGAAARPRLRHASGRGPVLEFRPERAAKAAAKNPVHLDLRLESGDEYDEVASRIADLGGSELHPDWGLLPWRVFADPSGNEFCVLPARA